MAAIPLSELRKLSVAERIQLAQDLWDSVAEDVSNGKDGVALPLTDEQREELDRRLDDAEANPGVGITWEELKARLLGTQ